MSPFCPGTVAHTAELTSHMAEAFRDPPERGHTNYFKKPGRNHRDALWYARRDAAGMLPLYRTHGYGQPHRTKGIDRVPVPREMPPWLEAAVDALQATLQLPHALNHVVAHRYVDGTDEINMHRDKTQDLVPDSHIVSLSLGATRDFRVGKDTYAMADGDAMVLSYALNEKVKHGVPKRRRVTEVRYSITARSIDSFYDPTTRTFRYRDAPAPVVY